MATLAFLRTVVDSAGKNTGEFECSACGKRFHPDKAHHGAVDIDIAFIEHRLTETISSPNGLPARTVRCSWPWWSVPELVKQRSQKVAAAIVVLLVLAQVVVFAKYAAR